MNIIESLLTNTCTNEYGKKIANYIMSEVKEDIKASAGEVYNTDDVRLAIGRVLINKLGIEE